MRLLTCVLPFVLASLSLATDDAQPDYIIVGAGGAGLQMALYLEKFGLSYAILEKESIVGSHFNKFPRFDELISINKWHRNESQRLRYDWHTLLEAPFPMYDLTQEYFPKGQDWHRYMTLVAQQAGIMPKIEFGVEVEQVSGDGTPCLELTDGSKRCANKRIFIGTGLEPRNEYVLEALGGIPYSQVTKDMAKGRRVCILGNGNSAFEVAQNLYPVADRVILYGRKAVRLSSVTRYTGDVRVKYLQVLENLHMKLLDTVDSFAKPPDAIEGLEDILTPQEIEHFEMATRVALWLQYGKCETFVIATGFQSRVPEGLTLTSKFPASNDWYQSPDNPSVHYIGWLMHERDFQRSAGGFLSGFRYLIRNLAHHVRQEDAGVPYPVETLTREQVISKTVARMQTASDIFILQDGVAIRDVICPIPEQPGHYLYYEGITHDFYPDLMARKDVISVYFAWGNGRTANAVFDGLIKYNDTNHLINVLLHPVVEVGGMVRGVMEDVELEWVGNFEAAISKTVSEALSNDLSNFLPKEMYPYEKTTLDQEDEPDQYERPDRDYPSLKLDDPLAQALWKAVYTQGRDKEVETLREQAKRWLPFLHDGGDSGSMEAEVEL